MNSILFIAPHEEIASIAKKTLIEMNLSIPLIVAKNKIAVNIAKQSESTSIIISRGGTVRDLKKYTNKIIVDIGISLTNILKSIEKLHLAGCKNIAIISNNNIIEPESSIINIHQTSVKICPYSNDEDVSKIIENLLPKNIDGIIGDIKPVELAKKYNIKNSIYIESDIISIRKAINEALILANKQQKKQLRLQTLQSIIDNINEGIIVYNLNKQPIFYNKLGKEILNNNTVLAGKKGTAQLNNYLTMYKGKILDINNVSMEIIKTLLISLATGRKPNPEYYAQKTIEKL